MFFVLSDLIITYLSQLFNIFLDLITIIANTIHSSRKAVPNSESDIDSRGDRRHNKETDVAQCMLL